jgi:hypothetical protein
MIMIQAPTLRTARVDRCLNAVGWRVGDYIAVRLISAAFDVYEDSDKTWGGALTISDMLDISRLFDTI